MARDDVVIGLDIGTTKVCTVIGHADDDGIVTISGVGLAPSRGVKKGVVVDVDDTVSAIRDSVERAAHMAGVTARTVVAGVTGDHVQSSNRKGTVTISGESGVVTEDDVERVMHAAAMDVPRDREIIHSLPRDFSVDGHKGVRRPVGMCGERLEVETHIVTGAAGFLQNVVQCVERAGLSVDALVLEPIATSEAVATGDERELGVALIDIGGGTSDIAVFLDGSIAFSTAIPIGGNHVTRDISIGLRTPFEIAEKLKLERGVAMPSLIPHGEALEVVSAGSGEKLRLPRAILGEIIEARMSELFEMARKNMEDAGIQSKLAGGVILTGGGAMLPGATDLAGEIFDLPIRLGTPIKLSGWSDKVDTPQFATGVGLLRFALRQPGTLGNPLATTANPAMSPAMADRRRRVWSAPGSGLTTFVQEPATQQAIVQPLVASPASSSSPTPIQTTSTQTTAAPTTAAPITAAPALQAASQLPNAPTRDAVSPTPIPTRTSSEETISSLSVSVENGALSHVSSNGSTYGMEAMSPAFQRESLVPKSQSAPSKNEEAADHTGDYAAGELAEELLTKEHDEKAQNQGNIEYSKDHGNQQFSISPRHSVHNTNAHSNAHSEASHSAHEDEVDNANENHNQKPMKKLVSRLREALGWDPT